MIAVRHVYRTAKIRTSAATEKNPKRRISLHVREGALDFTLSVAYFLRFFQYIPRISRGYLPIKGNKDDRPEVHRRAAERLLELLEQYPTIVYPVPGEPGICASGSCLMGLFRQKHPCEAVSGITTMCAAAGLCIPLCEQGESLTMLDSVQTDAELPSGNVVVMKSGRQLVP